MAVKTKPIYGAVLVLIALLIVSVVGGVYYYSEYNQATRSKGQFMSELIAANSQYDSLTSNYNSSLSLNNKTLSLLAEAISVVNTSLPVYGQASAELSRLWEQYLNLEPAKNMLYSANILVDFGNGSRHWFNDTQVQPGWNAFITTVVLTSGNLHALWFPQYQEHLIMGIDGVSNSKNASWWLWVYNSKSSWQFAQVGADEVPVYNGSVLAWTFCGMTPAYTPACTP